MAETLLSPSSIMLYGRLMTDLTLDRAPHVDEGRSGNEFLRQQLGRVLGADDISEPQLARIYGFSYEGHYYDLARPAIFVVHGPGVDAGPPAPHHRSHGVGAANPAGDLPAIGAVPPGTVDQSGVAAKGWDIMEDVKVWTYDRGDFSLRLDIDSGKLEDILLEAELGEDLDEAFYSGSRARVSGSRAQVSGSRARVSGSRARVSGSRARGRDHSD